ncbi:MAG TPA: hypothetical protein VH277_08400 [Gemmatimonadaceae bacterium]|jgi:hypothetical protein|nr:hypothetical protein [Gemmatimonadaceae bacterium]
MYVIREIMYCKPGKVRALGDKFLAMSKVSVKMSGKREIYRLESR